jgi:hypothetical protein
VAGAGRGRGSVASAFLGGLPLSGRTLGKPLPGAIVGSVPAVKQHSNAVAAPGPDLASMLAGADLKNLLGVGSNRGGTAPKPGGRNSGGPAAKTVTGGLSLADLERQMNETSIEVTALTAPTAPTAPIADDPAAFWTALAGGSPANTAAQPRATAQRRQQVTVPPAPKTKATAKAKAGTKAVPKPSQPAAPNPVSLAELEEAQGVPVSSSVRVVSVPVPVVPVPVPVPVQSQPPKPMSLAELERTTASSASSTKQDEDPLAFWATLQAQHRLEAEKLTGTAVTKNAGARGGK